jgi:hypothetical protein
MRVNTALRVSSEWNITPFEPKNLLLCLKQVQLALNPEWNQNPHILPKKKEHELSDLKKHFEELGIELGIIIKWEEKNGMIMPYIFSNTEEVILSKEIITL